MSTKHHEACTWENHLAAGETPPGQSFWGQLNYLWCQANCKVDPSDASPMIDVTDVLQKAVRPDGTLQIG